jgi:hypothetical protein
VTQILMAPVTATGPDILARAAVLFPAVVGPGPMLAIDCSSALYQAARLLRAAGDDDRAHARAHVLADEAGDMFTAYLTEQGDAAAELTTARTLRGWMLGHRRVSTVVIALRAAAEYYRREHAELLADVDNPESERAADPGRRR